MCSWVWVDNQRNNINRFNITMAITFRLTFKMGCLWWSLSHWSRNIIFHFFTKRYIIQQNKPRFTILQDVGSFITGFISTICKFITFIIDSLKDIIFSFTTNQNIFNLWRCEWCNCEVILILIIIGSHLGQHTIFGWVFSYLHCKVRFIQI